MTRTNEYKSCLVSTNGIVVINQNEDLLLASKVILNARID